MAEQGQAQTVQDEELQKHTIAYLNLFRSVLNRRPLSDDQKRSTLLDLKTYLESQISDTDEFIDHLDEFARKMGVSSQALGNFIGSNFLKALEQADKEVEEKEKSARSKDTKQQGSQDETPKSHDSILEEMDARLDLSSPGRFVQAGFGIMKLSNPDGDVYGQSAFEPDIAPLLGVGVAKPAGGGEDTESSPDGGPGATKNQKQGAPAQDRSPAQGGDKKGKTVTDKEPEKPLIDEILDKFSSVLKVQQKLVVPPFPAGMAPEGESEGGQESDTVSEGSSATAAAKDRTQESDSSAAGKKASFYDTEESTPIIDEILDKFGSKLKVQGKLEVPAFPPGMSEEGDETQPAVGTDSTRQGESQAGDSGGFPGSADHDDEDNGESQDDFDELELTFTDYMDGVKRVQEFQKARDREGYAKWLHARRDALPIAMAIKSAESRAKKQGKDVDLELELTEVASHHGVDPGQVEELQSRLRAYDTIRNILQHLVQASKSQGGDTLPAIQKIWPQIKMLFNDSANFQSLQSRFKIILLQVGDSNTRERIRAMVTPYLEKAASAMEDFTGHD